MKKIIYIFGLMLLTFLCISCGNTITNNEVLKKVEHYFIFPYDVTGDLEFPDTIRINGKDIMLEWSTSDNAISKDGIVTRRDEDVDVLISVTARIDNDSMSFDLTTVRVLGLKNVYSISYDLDGGTATELVTKFFEGDNVVLRTPYKYGYDFIGWYEGNKKIETITNRNYSLTAHWQKKESLVVILDEEVLYVGSESEITIKGYNDLSLFNITVSDESVAYVDSEGYLICLKKGKTSITFSLKKDSEIFTIIDVEVLNRKPVLSRENKPITIGKELSLKLSYYDDISLFDISYDQEYLSFNDGKFTALKEGNTQITYTFKNDVTAYCTYDLIIYPIEPVLAVSNNTIVVGNTTRIDILNYDDTSDLMIKVSEETAEIDGRIIKAIKRGDITVTVSLISNPLMTSSLTIHVLPITPVIYLSREDILVGGLSHLYFDNLEELDDQELENYQILISDNTIVSLSDFTIQGLKIGSSDITIRNKNDEELTSTIKINVIPNPEKYDSDSEIIEGKLYLEHKDNSDFDGYIHAGDMDYFTVYGSRNSTKYNWVSSNTTVITVFEDGRYIAVGKGKATIMATRKGYSEVVGRITIKVYGEPNIDYVSRLIQIAESQLGYVEGPNNDTKYGTWYGLPNEEWCAMFVSWCANQSGISTDIIPKYAGCTAGKNWFEEHGLFRYKEDYIPKAGDIIFFLSDGAGHTGIVIYCDGNRVYTIEGNTSDMCAKRNYDVNWHTITGYGTPAYPPYSGETSGGDISGSTDGSGHSTH